MKRKRGNYNGLSSDDTSVSGSYGAQDQESIGVSMSSDGSIQDGSIRGEEGVGVDRNDLYSKFMKICSSHKVSQECKLEMWRFLYDECENMAQLKVISTVHRSYFGIKKSKVKEIPTCSMDISLRSRVDGKQQLLTNVAQFPKKFMNKVLWEKEYVITYLNLKDIIAYHLKNHDEAAEVDLSTDGIPEDVSSGRSMDVYTLKFTNCRVVYPWRIFVQGTVTKLSLSELIQPIIDELKKNQLKVRLIVADAPKRSFVRNMKSHSGYFACDYCLAPGSHQVNKNGKKIGGIIYPFSESSAPFRNNESYREIGEEISQNPDRSPLYACGIKGKSPLYDLEYFDMVEDIPTEYMHLVCLGICRKLLKIIFYGETASQKMSSRNVNRIQIINNSLKSVCVPKEFSRRTRDVDLKNYKAEEFRNILIAFHSVFVAVMDETESKLFNLLSFLTRALLLPDEYYEMISRKYDMQAVVDMFCMGFDAAFGGSCSYNIHIFRHILKVRKFGPLSESSAFPFESYFFGTQGVIRKWYPMHR